MRDEGVVEIAADDMSAIEAYARFYDAHRPEITAELTSVGIGDDPWRSILEALLPASGTRSPDLDALRRVGTEYAHRGVAYAAWLAVIAQVRMVMRRRLAVLGDGEPTRATTTRLGLDRFFDLAVQHVGETFLGATEAHYQLLFEQSPLPMWTYDRDTMRFLAVNEAAVRHYGYTREEFAAMTLADIRPSEDEPKLRASVREAAGHVSGRVWLHRRKDGTLIHAEVAANDFTEGGRQLRLVVINDVTRRIEAEQRLCKTEEQLHHAQKMDAIGGLAGGVAHDFNNLLTVIQSYACILEEELDPTDRRRGDATEIRRAAERAGGITRQLLTLSRHSVAAPRSLDIDDLVSKFVPMLRRLLGEHIALVVQGGRVPLVVADPGKLEQVLMNLAVNARDAMPDGGRLTIETEVVIVHAEHAPMEGLAAGRYVVVAVTDTGTGMDATTRARIFDPFFTTKEVGKGTGLGLAIVHGIVKQAGGNIAVYSELGHGTTFRVYVPASNELVVAPEPAAVEALDTLPEWTVLVVDDEREVRSVASRILSEAGCRVLEAATADEARRICVNHETTIDVVVLDVVLPDSRGDALVHQLRELRPSVQVLLMSGYPAGALSSQGATPGQFLSKPFTPTSLRAAVARCAVPRHEAHTRDGDQSPIHEHRKRILVADDDDALRKTIVRLLRRAGFETVEAADGASAMAQLGGRPFDVVLSDVHMPGADGLDVMRAIRRIDLDVPILLMSGTPDVASATAAVEYGAFRYLTKPLDADALVKCVQHAARTHAFARVRREALSTMGGHVGAVDRVGLEVRFDQALDRLWMAFQPIFEAKTGLLYGVEALVRSSEPSMANPLVLLDAATQLSRLPELGRRVRALSAAALADRADLVLFVNLHPEDLLDAELVAEDAPLTKIASRVVLEVTERASLVSSPELRSRIGRLRAHGFRLAIDDIGAGYSGLTSFAELAPETVKIDMSLVRDIHLSALKQRTVKALCLLCHESESLVIGEGVETTEERDCLVSLGCDLLQGYLLGRPARELP